MDLIIIFEQIGMLAILTLIGVIAYKFKVITEDVKKGIVNIIFNITLPLLIIVTIAKQDLTKEIIQNSGLVILFTYLSLFLFFVGGKLSAKLLKIPNRSAPVHILHTLFGNIVLLGFPLIDALFPNTEALLYAALFQLASVSLLWTLGINTLSNKKHHSWKQNLKNLLNPNTISFFIGLALMFLPFHMPKFIEKPLHGLGECTFYLSMLYIGAMLAELDLKKILKPFHIFILSFNKLLLLPFLLMLLIYILLLVSGVEMSFVAISVVVLESAMPCQVIITILARRYNQDDVLATKNLMVSTILSIITLPLVFWITTQIF